MASENHGYHNGDPLFVSPDRLVLDQGMNRRDSAQQQTTYGHTQPRTHHQTVWASQQANHQRPNLSMHGASVSDWTVPTAQTFRTTNLPPTPISPFRPLRPLSEDEKLAFPCTGTLTDCWNSELCPKHRDDSKQQRASPPDFHLSSSRPSDVPNPNPRRRSAPASDLQPPPAKIKRTTTDPEEETSPRPRHFSICTSTSTSSRDRQSISRTGRVPHNLVERRYRDNLNNQIECLRLTLPSLKDANPSPSTPSDEDIGGMRMPSKAVIISTAATYIKDMGNERTRLLAANKALQEQVLGLQKLVGGRCEDCSIMGYLSGMQIHQGHGVVGVAPAGGN